MTPGVAVRVALAVLRRPSLWPVALRQWRLTTPRQWWRRRPFLPLPSRDYVGFRLVTQYGREDAPISAGDVLDYLAWCKRQARAA
jgi:hypothetical protein